MTPLTVFLKKQLRAHWMFLIFFAFFALLLARNPFSTRTVIPNLEPYPDSFHYVISTMSFLRGYGFTIEREGRTIRPSVPPLYSLSFAPAFLLYRDVRMFYLVNVLLSLGTLTVYYALIRRLFTHQSIRGMLLLLWVTSSMFIWFPSLAMAENLLILIYVSALWLLAAPLTKKNSILAGFIAVAFYATKYASLPLSGVFPLLYGVKLLWGDESLSWKSMRKLFRVGAKLTMLQRLWLWYLASLAVFGSLDLAYEYFAKDNNVIGGLFSLFVAIVLPQPTAPGDAGSTGGFFGLQFVRQNVHSYGNWLIGNPIQVLWKNIVILPKIFALPALIGWLVAVWDKRTRLLGASLIIMVSAVFAFMSVFYAFDGRYMIIAIPSLFVGFGFFLSFVAKSFPALQRTFSLLLIICGLLFFATQFRALKLQIALNLKYAETPWYYVSIQTMDQYLHAHQSEFAKTPVVISAIPPYMYDVFATSKPIMLPLHMAQEFRSYPKQAWGDHDYSNLEKLYTEYIEAGHPVFLTQYGLGNEKYLQIQFATLLEDFDATKIQDGCFNLCAIYQLHVKRK